MLTDDGGGIVDLTRRLGIDGGEPLLEYVCGDNDAGEHPDGDLPHDPNRVKFKVPVKRPGQVIAARINYETYIDEEGDFLKALSSIVGTGRLK